MEEYKNYSTFECFKPHFNTLARVGYFKIVPKPLSHAKQRMHNVYRFVSCFLVILYNLQHLARVIQVRHSTDQIIDTLFILLTTLNTLGKEAAFNLRSRRIDGLINFINGPYFAAHNSHHVEVLKRNSLKMSRLLKLYHMAVLICGISWAVFPGVNKILGEEVPFTGYIPFDTTSTLGFVLALAYMNILITFQAFGNVTMDCTIVALYSQAQAQINILRHNLEQLVVFDDIQINTLSSHKYTYKDDVHHNAKLQERLKNCAVHYKEILRYVKEIESIFGEAMVIQFIIMAWVICMTVYKIVGLSITSAEFISMAVYLVCMLAQLFIYCYFGTQLKVESEFVNESIYFSGWLSLSPGFRRQLLVMMVYCSRPIAPRTAYIIPMSLETYIAVLRLSYTLFTFLKREN